VWIFKLNIYRAIEKLMVSLNNTNEQDALKAHFSRDYKAISRELPQSCINDASNMPIMLLEK